MAEKDWSENGRVFFCGGYGWGIREVGSGNIRDLKSVCLGTEADVKKQLRDGVRNSNETPYNPSTA